MDWTTILVSLGGFAGIATIIEIMRDWRNKKKKSTVDVQNDQIDLGSKFIKMASELGDMISNGNKDVLDGMRNLRSDVNGIKNEMTNIVSYLNGDYQNFKHKKEDEEKDEEHNE